MRIALLTVHHAPNCGAMLQAWALMRVLQQLGHEVEFPDCNHIDYRGRTKPFPSEPGMSVGRRLKNWLRNRYARAIFLPTMSRFEDFVHAHMPESRLHPPEFASRYDAVVVGSDQLWNERIMGDDTDLFLCSSVPPGIRVISYGTSFGDVPPVGKAAERVLCALPRFAAVGVREARGVAFLDAAGIKAQVTADPTLLLPPEEYLAVASPCHPCVRYLYVYSLFFDRDLMRLAKTVAARRHLKVVYTPLSQYTRYGMPRGIDYGVTPDRFVSFVAHAECVLTDSFHGTAFSLIFGKPFASFCRADDPAHSRHGELLRMVGCLDRQMTFGDATADSVCELLSRPCSSEVGKRLAEIRADGRKWLTEKLG